MPNLLPKVIFWGPSLTSCSSRIQNGKPVKQKLCECVFIISWHVLLIFLLIYLYCLFLFSLELFTGANLHMAHLMPLPLTVSSLSCFSKIQIGFTFLVPAHPSSPDKKVVKWVFVCAYSVVYYRVLHYLSAVSTVSLPVFFVMASITEAGRQMWTFFDELRSFFR